MVLDTNISIEQFNDNCNNIVTYYCIAELLTRANNELSQADNLILEDNGEEDYEEGNSVSNTINEEDNSEMTEEEEVYGEDENLIGYEDDEELTEDDEGLIEDDEELTEDDEELTEGDDDEEEEGFNPKPETSENNEDAFYENLVDEDEEKVIDELEDSSENDLDASFIRLDEYIEPTKEPIVAKPSIQQENNRGINNVEPSVLEYVRKHPYCDINEVISIYTKKEVEIDLKVGKIYKVKNRLYV